MNIKELIEVEPYKSCFEYGELIGEQNGRIDAINEVIRLINSKHATIQYSEQTDKNTITLYNRDTKWLKEQLKEQKND